MNPRNLAVLALALHALVWLSQSPAGETRPSAAGDRFFEDRVRPVLAERCFKCHGPTKQKGGLRLDSRAAILGGGGRGPALTPGNPEKSLLIQAIRQENDDLKMPPSKKLPREQIADLTEWVKRGAPWPESVAAVVHDPREAVLEKGRNHWSFQPLKRPPVPLVKDTEWVANPIDAFILARLEARGLHPNSAADKPALIRRLSYDLTGLPPTPGEVADFVSDSSSAAYEKLVDRLLASPHYGEKWGRHWLDLVRFAETNSYERDGDKPHAWRYRDYVIRSFNDDKRYDRFAREQLAGDELPDRDDDALIATGYYRLGIWDDEPSDQLQARYDGLDDIVATTGQVFLGLTLDCARCHDHKFDPIAQKDYYRLLAFFHNVNPYRNGGPTDEVPLGASGKNGYRHGVLPSQSPFFPDALKHGLAGKRDGPLPKGPKGGKAKVQGEMALSVTEAGNRAPPTFVLLRGNPHVQGEEVQPAFPQILSSRAPTLSVPAPGAASTGRRRILADWIVSADNPLPARVLANRLWQHHFGRGIVRSPNDFGAQGDRPTHPELLDWLAEELVRRNWRLKPLHRLIVTSNAYRMSSQGSASGLAADPANDLFWRFDMRRLGAEEIRDSILALSGNLGSKMYGPGVYPEIPAEVKAGQSMPGHGWGHSPEREQYRRSVYIHVKRSLLTPILEAFDLAETDRSTPVRFTTTQPTQTLALLNSQFMNGQASAFAVRLCRETGGGPEAQVRLAFALATGRSPDTRAVRRSIELIEMLRSEERLSADCALADFCLLVFNLNEFLYLD